MMLNTALAFLITYLIGAIPTGYWLGLACGVDVTKVGSNSIGATNVLRVVGKWQAIVVLVVDILKGFLPIFYFKYLTLTDGWIVLALSIVPILAHSKSVFIGFKGGKSSATGFGVLMALNWIVGLITIAIWISTVKISKYSSLGSIVCIPLVPLWLWFFGESLPIIMFGVIAFIYIVLIKHRSNIKRLLDGTEPKVGEKSE